MNHSILIVDDDKGLRSLYRLILEKNGYDVTEAMNGSDALRLLVNYTPDVIIMDMLMPMLGGEAVMKRIKEMPALKNVKIVVVTAYPRFRESAQFLEPDGFLIKPVQSNELLKAVEAVLAGQG